MPAIKVRPNDTQARFVALSAGSRDKIVAEGRTVKSTIRKAKETGQAFSLFTLPPANHTLIL